MLTYYCPECWQVIAGTEECCPYCGYALTQSETLSFEEKLIQALRHPIPERRLLAIQILGQLGSQAALPELEFLLDNERHDIYVLRETLVALSKIQGSRSQEVLQKAAGHPLPIIRKLAKRLLEKSHVK